MRENVIAGLKLPIRYLTANGLDKCACAENDEEVKDVRSYNVADCELVCALDG